jgi:hypothetical protein
MRKKHGLLAFGNQTWKLASSVSLSSTAARYARARQLNMRSAPTGAINEQPRVENVQIIERSIQESRVSLWRVAIPTAATHV